MLDKNGIEIKTGQVVEITGAYFKNDNGLYFVDRSPGDPSWCGSDYSLKKISKAGRVSKAKHNICFWPIKVFVSNRSIAAKARAWNDEHAQIEIKSIKNMSQIAAHFQALGDELTAYIRRATYDFGADAESVILSKRIQAHYWGIASAIMGEEVDAHV